MKTFTAILLAFTAASSFAQSKEAATTYKVDTEQSKVLWLAKKVTGQHNGSIKIKSGTLVTKGMDLVGGEIIIDMNSLDVLDITDAETKGKFMGHMKSGDFFETEKYPEAKLVIKSSKKVGKGVEVKGDLTMKGKTNSVTFLVIPKKVTDNSIGGTTTLALDRTKWHLKYGSGKFFQGLGDKMIHDEFTLTIDVTAKK